MRGILSLCVMLYHFFKLVRLWDFFLFPYCAATTKPPGAVRCFRFLLLKRSRTLHCVSLQKPERGACPRVRDQARPLENLPKSFTIISLHRTFCLLRYRSMVDRKRMRVLLSLLIPLACMEKLWTRTIAVSCAIAASSHFSFTLLDPTISLSEQWPEYVHPLNHILLFVGGMAVGSALTTDSRGRPPFALLGLSPAVFFVIAFSFDTEQGIHGVVRLILISVCISWCYGAGKLRNGCGYIGKVLDWLGARSYSVYLLHLIVFSIAFKAIEGITKTDPHRVPSETSAQSSTFSIAVIATLIVSHISYVTLERPMMKLGRSMLPPRTKSVSLINPYCTTGH